MLAKPFVFLYQVHAVNAPNVNRRCPHLCCRDGAPTEEIVLFVVEDQSLPRTRRELRLHERDRRLATVAWQEPTARRWVTAA